MEDILKAHPEMEFVQLQLNYLDWENTNVQARFCYEASKKFGKQVIVMEPVKEGTLARVPQRAEDLMRGYQKDASPAKIPIPKYFSLYKEHQQFGERGNARLYYDTYQDWGKASECVGCGQCEAHCLQHLAIPEYMRQASEIFDHPQK